MRRAAGLIAAASLTVSGCVARTYRIPHEELVRLAQTPPAERGQRVRVVQELGTSPEPAPYQPVTAETEVVIVPTHVDVGGGGRVGGHHHPGGGGGHLPVPSNGHADNAKAEAIAYIVLAATALFVLAVTEGERYDGWVQLHPMMPVHIWGPWGYGVVPLAQIDLATAEMTTRAVVRPGEGPWRELGRAPLDRVGLSYSVLGGATTVTSVDGTTGLGAGAHILIGGYPLHSLGVLADFDFAWRPNVVNQTAFIARFGVELDVLPVDLGPLHGGLYGELGFVRRQEDGLANADTTSGRGELGTLWQLELTTRLALTGRVGIGHELGAQTRDLSIGLSVY